MLKMQRSGLITLLVALTSLNGAAQSKINLVPKDLQEAKELLSACDDAVEAGKEALSASEKVVQKQQEQIQKLEQVVVQKEQKSQEITQQPWFWMLIGVAVGVVSVGVAGGIANNI